MKKIYLFILVTCCAKLTMAQVVINPKGTKVTIDSSKWKIVGNNIYFKNTGNVGIGTTTPSAQLHTTNTVRFQGIGTNTTDTKILTADAAGNITTRILSSLPTNIDSTTSNNGLTLTGKNIQLGGNLTQATTITNNANPLTIATGGTAFNITGLTAGASTDSLVTVNTTTGKINRINLTSLNKVDSTTSNNGLTLTGKNVQLGGNLTQATTITNNANPLTIATGGTALNITGLTGGSSTDSLVTLNTTTGKINRINLSSLNKVDSTTTSNGLNLVGKDVRLGGNLTQATTITNNANPLTIATGGTALNITGLPTGALTDNVVVVDNTSGQLKKIAIPTIIQPSVIEVFDGLGTQVLTNTFTNLNFGNTNIADVGYTSASGVITIANAGLYKVTLRVSVRVTNNTNCGGEFQLTNAGGVIFGTNGYTYQRNNDNSNGTVTIVKILNLNAGSVIAAQGRRYTANGNLTMVSNGSSLLIEKIR
jgi:hypothetical protein